MTTRWPTSSPTSSTAGTTRAASTARKTWPRRVPKPARTRTRGTEHAHAAGPGMVRPGAGTPGSGGGIRRAAGRHLRQRAARRRQGGSGAGRAVPPAHRAGHQCEYLAFVREHPQWRRDKVAGILADARYLTQWAGADELGEQALPRQPVTRVSWFAAQAYCESEGARLPSWYEWEFAAAADASRRDARADPAWRENILGWYSRP